MLERRSPSVLQLFFYILLYKNNENFIDLCLDMGTLEVLLHAMKTFIQRRVVLAKHHCSLIAVCDAHNAITLHAVILSLV